MPNTVETSGSVLNILDHGLTAQWILIIIIIIIGRLYYNQKVVMNLVTTDILSCHILNYESKLELKQLEPSKFNLDYQTTQ